MQFHSLFQLLNCPRSGISLCEALRGELMYFTLKLINIFADLRIDSSSIPLDLRLCSHLATLSRLCPCPCAFTAQHSVSRDIVTDSREDLTNSVAAAVQGKSKFRGLDCNRGTKSVMKR